jgi:hypothetical protein
MVIQANEAQPTCAYCGTTKSEKSALFLLDQLLRSQEELCATVRQVGRRMLRFEDQDDGSLDRIRRVLKRADNVRKSLRSLEELPEAPSAAIEATLEREVSGLASESRSGQLMPDVAVHKRVQKSRLSTPRSLRVIRFPSS